MTMTAKKVYVRAGSLISAQEPFSDAWRENPLALAPGLNKAVDPPFRPYLDSTELRRLPLIIKRAIAASSECLSAAGIPVPNAIITGTGLGCCANNQEFLRQLIESGGRETKPTYFINSTHNSIGSAAAIKLKARGYNSTYSQGMLSFDCALHNALMLISSGRAGDALVLGCDEMTPSYHELLLKAGIAREAVPYGEVAAAFVLSASPENALCRIDGIRLSSRSGSGEAERLARSLAEAAGISLEDIDIIVTSAPDLCRSINPSARIVDYKHIFGDGYSSSAAGFYAATRQNGCTLVINDAGEDGVSAMLIIKGLGARS